MKKLSPMESLQSDKIVPVVVIDNVADALPLAETLEQAGLHNIEITLRTPAALEAVERVARNSGLCVGAGTVLSVEQAKAAVQANASFLVSPGTNPKVVAHCVDQGIPIFPGVCSPSDIELAMSFGLKTVKFFPAEAAGGPSFLKAISAPYGGITFIPTGGINADNFLSYASLPSVLACGASWIVDKKLIATHDWEEITRRCKALGRLLKENNL